MLSVNVCGDKSSLPVGLRSTYGFQVLLTKAA